MDADSFSASPTPAEAKPHLDDADLNSVGVGFEAETASDVLPDDISAGQVVHAEPKLVRVQDVAAACAEVWLDAIPHAERHTVPIGATVTSEPNPGQFSVRI
jgi:hypothetical protein